MFEQRNPSIAKIKLTKECGEITLLALALTVFFRHRSYKQIANNLFNQYAIFFDIQLGRYAYYSEERYNQMSLIFYSLCTYLIWFNYALQICPIAKFEQITFDQQHFSSSFNLGVYQPSSIARVIKIFLDRSVVLFTASVPFLQWSPSHWARRFWPSSFLWS